MESQKMNELLEKYWQGETTLEEEAKLRQYFREHEPPAHLRPVAALFQHYEAPPRLSQDFDQQIEVQLRGGKVISMWPTLLRIAAVVAIFIAGALWMKRTYLEETPVAAPMAVVTTDTYEDPEKAYEEAKQALLLVSSLMNEGTTHLTKLEEFDEAQQTVKERPKAKL